MIRVAHDFADSSPVAGTAAMITGYTLGGAIGPSISGAVLDATGAVGQAVWLTLMAATVIAVARRFSASPAVSASA
jgi:fucose permease